MVNKQVLKIIALLSIIGISLATFSVMSKKLNSSEEELQVSSQVFSFRYSKEIVNDMGVGWNLGNTFDSIVTWLGKNAKVKQYEMAWGNPETTKEMIDEIKKSGFKTVRIPVSWGQHMDDEPKYTIREKWMDRVQEVVDYCIENELYVILNVHSDGEWCIPTYEKKEEVSNRLTSLWTQIANRFQNYDDHLIFETLNEPRLEDSKYEWNGGNEETRNVVNEYNAIALKAIRNTGGNNKKRSVMIPTYAASGMEVVINDMIIPDDDYIIVSIHSYSPYEFSMLADNTTYWGTIQDKETLNKELDKYYNAFVTKGIPIVIGEFGSINKNNTESRSALAGYFVSEAKKRGMACVWWDNNQITENASESYGLFDRSNLEWYFPEIKESMINSYNATSKYSWK